MDNYVSDIFEAVSLSDYNACKYLIQKGSDVNCCNKDGDSPLHLAIEKGCTDIALLLIKNGSDINCKNLDGKTPLFIAAQRNNLAVVKILLGRPNVNVNLFCYGKTPLYAACEQDCVSVVKEFIDNHKTMFWNDVRYHQDLPLHVAVALGFCGVTEILLDKITSVNCLDSNGRTPLWIALIEQRLELAKILINNYRVNVNFMYGGNSPLIYAISQSMEDIAKLLVLRGANLNTKDPDKRNALHHCALRGLPDTLQLLIDRGGDTSASDSKGCTPLHCAVTQWNLDVIRILIDSGVDLEKRISNVHYSSVQLAVKRGNLEVAKYLIERGADINAWDPQSHFACNRGGTLLHWACRNYDGDRYIRFLVENGAEINAEATDGRTPLCLAVKHQCSFEVLKYLIDNGASLNTDRGGTPLYWAFYMRYYDIASLLIEWGTDVNSVIDNFSDEWVHHRYPLHMAEDISLVKLLISKGANVNALDKQGNSPLHLASSLPIAKYLIDNGANIACRNFNGDTPLHTARSVHIAEFLIEKGVDVGTPNLKGYVPLHTASTVNIAELLLEMGADIRALTSEGKTVIHTAAERDVFDSSGHIISYFIEKGVDPNQLDNRGDSALKLSSINYNSNVAKVLLNNGATLRLFNVELDGSPVYYLKWLNEFLNTLKSDEPVKKFLGLIRSFLPLNYKEDDTRSTVMHTAAHYDRQEFIEFVLNKKKTKGVDDHQKQSNRVNINSKDAHGLTPLHIAASKNNIQIVKLFLSGGAIYNVKTSEHKTPFDLTTSDKIRFVLNTVQKAFQAISQASVDDLLKCIDRESSVINALDENGCSLLHVACRCRQQDAVLLLLQRGIDISLVNDNKETALHVASSLDCHDTVSQILQHSFQSFRNSHRKSTFRRSDYRFFGEFINWRDFRGRSALHVAGEFGSVDTVKLLLRLGGMFDLQDYEGKTPADYSTHSSVSAVLSMVQDIFTRAKRGESQIFHGYEETVHSVITSCTVNRFGDNLSEFSKVNGYDELAKSIEESIQLPHELVEYYNLNSPKRNSPPSDDSLEFTFDLFQ